MTLQITHGYIACTSRPNILMQSLRKSTVKGANHRNRTMEKGNS